MTPTVDSPRHLSAIDIEAATDVPFLVSRVEEALLAGFDPATDPIRQVIPTPAGQLLVMPSVSPSAVGVKIVGIAPGNTQQGLPLINGTYVLLDGATLAPIATLDGAALTTIRTAIISGIAMRHLANGPVQRAVVFGAGPQAWSHLRVLSDLMGVEDVAVIGRSPGNVTSLL